MESKKLIPNGVFVVVQRENKIFFTQRIDNRLFELPGGEISEAENIFAAASRELRQEGGLDAPVESFTLEGEFSGARNIVFLVSVGINDCLEVPVELNEDGDEEVTGKTLWLTQEDILALRKEKKDAEEGINWAHFFLALAFFSKTREGYLGGEIKIGNEKLNWRNGD